MSTTRDYIRNQLLAKIAEKRKQEAAAAELNKKIELAGREKRVFSHDTLNGVSLHKDLPGYVDYVASDEKENSNVNSTEVSTPSGEGPGITALPDLPLSSQKKVLAFAYNDQQLDAITSCLNSPAKESILIGAAGTGKTTCVKEIISQWTSPERNNPRFNHAHKTLPHDAFAFACVSYTNRAVRNMRRVLPSQFEKNCLTIHKLLEYFFEFYEEFDEEKQAVVKKVRSVPARTKLNPLTGLKFLIVDEASMVGLNLWGELYEALPKDCKILFLGDLQQLPPIYDSAILGYKISWAYERGKNAPHLTELTQVYRQALDNPILFFAHQILKNEWKDFPPAKVKSEAANRGTNLVFKCFSKKVEEDLACLKVGRMFRQMIKEGQFDTENDIILIPFNKKFGTLELNKHVAQELQEQRKVKTYEILSGFLKHYLCVGDRVLYGRFEGVITSINRNGNYLGTRPTPESIYMTRWGTMRPELDSQEFLLEQSEVGDWKTQDLDKILAASNKDDAKRQASHVITLRIDETDEEMILENAGEVNKLLLAYAITVHKSQGAEWRRVFFILHSSHYQMLSRELLYTGVTRAREELIIICEPDAIEKGIQRQRIPGQTLKEKAEFFKGKQEEMQKKSELESLLYKD